MAARSLFAITQLLAAPAAATGEAPARTPDIHFKPTRHAIADATLRLAGVTAEDVVYDRPPTIAAMDEAEILLWRVPK